MKKHRQSTLHILLVTTLFMTIASALAIHPAEAGSDMSKGLDSRAKNSQAGFPTNQLLVKYKTDANLLKEIYAPLSEARMQMMRLASGVNLEYLRGASNGVHVLRLPDRLPLTEIQKIAKDIAALPDVEYAEPDYIMFPALTPNDPQYASQWHYFETYGINLPEAWNYTFGSSNVRIAVLDSGITDHVDLAGRWVGGYDFISNIPTANDGNGRDSDPHDPGNWITFAESSSGTFAGCPITNSTWHGTHVAGTIGAAGNNGIGVAGVNWVSPIVPVRVLGKCGGFTSDITDGMRWAAGLSVSGVPTNSNSARVLNLSLAGLGMCSTTYQNAIDAVNAVGAIVVVAAGNNSANLNTTTIQPANCNGVITVAATDRGGDKASSSNYGSTIEISAPGGETVPTLQNGILSTLNTGTTSPGADTYGYYSGTSMAVPHVSGVISLMLSLDSTLTSAEILQILQSTARTFPVGSNCTTSTCGSGIVDAASALTTVGVPDLPEPFNKIAPSNGAINQTTNPTLQWSSSNGAASYEYCYDTSNDNVCSDWINNNSVASILLSGLSEGTTYYWHVRAINAGGVRYSNDSAVVFWSFTTASSPPGAFNKLSPTDGATNQPANPTLSWSLSSDSASYEYCLDITINAVCDVTWTSNGTSTSKALTGLTPGTLYEWQVRAVNLGGTTYSNATATAFWSFTTIVNPPTAFNKIFPSDGATNQPTDLTLSWNSSSGATSYEYCLDLTIDNACNGSWTSNGPSTSKSLTGLNPGTNYEWHVRAVNTGGTTFSNNSGSAFWSFATAVNPPVAFNKTGPPNGATGQSTSPTLNWGSSFGAMSYEYCYDMTNDNACSGWTSNGASTSKSLNGLSASTTYYWHIRAINSGGTTYANDGSTAFWSFTTTTNPPGAFNKSSPANGAMDQSASATLSWGSSSGATSYEFCYDTTNDTICSNWVSNGSSTSKVLGGLNAGVTYYWHIRAINSGGATYANGSSTAFWSFTTLPNHPAAFDKGGPSNGATNQPTSLTLTWDSSMGAISYEYCYDTSNDNACSSWTSNGSSTSKALSGLNGGTTYFWQVRAINSGGVTYANGSPTVFWSFATETSTIVYPFVVSIVRANGNPTSESIVGFMVVFSEMVTGVDMNDFALMTTGISDASITSVSGSGITRNIIVNTGSGHGTIRLDVVDDNTIVDAASNPLGGVNVGDGDFTSGEAYTIAKPANIQVQIGDSEVAGSPYTVGRWDEKRLNYHLSDGPVVVHSTNAIDIVSAIRLQSFGNNTLYSFVETMGVPSGLLSHKYYFPTYNNTWTPLNSQIRFGNLDASATTVRVTIGADVVWEDSVPGLGEKRLNFPVSGGPVVVESLDASKPIVAAIRLQSFANNTLYSFAETMGIPVEQLSDTYYFPTYNNTWAPLNSQLRIGNLDASATTVRVMIGADVVWEDVVPGSGEKRLNFNVSGGPVKVESLDPAKQIVAAIRLQSFANNTLYSFVETMGVPSGLLSHKYSFPTYNNTWIPLNSQIRIGNLAASATTVRVTIGRDVVWEDSVPGQGEKRLNFPVSGGPVVIESLDPAQPIVAAIRLQSFANNTLYSFAETMGIPVEQVSDTYYFPTYNNTWTPLNSQLRFGVP